MKTLIQTLLILFLFTACESNLFDSSEKEEERFYASKVSDGLEIELLVESEDISSLHDIEAVFSLTNLSDREITFGFPSGCQWAYQVKQNKQIIYDSTEDLFCTMATSALQINPGETKSMSISPTRIENQELERGSYTLNAFLLEDHGVEISTSFESE